MHKRVHVQFIRVKRINKAYFRVEVEEHIIIVIITRYVYKR